MEYSRNRRSIRPYAAPRRFLLPALWPTTSCFPTASSGCHRGRVTTPIETIPQNSLLAATSRSSVTGVVVPLAFGQKARDSVPEDVRRAKRVVSRSRHDQPGLRSCPCVEERARTLRWNDGVCLTDDG